ncbi:hypothetical protein GO730_28415 [Spirosoma sp. HMF3257]|uniref:Lipoprotein n=1 Tax=Spirosoma telluris TaxID=2183553 RepID=A0A327NQX3_9BACT|nr:hypothetical protein [Spirosoma telluris]RAI77125.1 hypothetical protein HMF3257_28355 [Spirosoma telluris]
MRTKLYIFLSFLVAGCSQKVSTVQTATKSVDNLKRVTTTPFVVNDRPMRQLLVNQTRAISVQGKISGLSSLQNRKRLQIDLDRLRQNPNATQTDYQNLSRRVDIIRQVELSVLRNVEITRTSAPRHHRASSKPMAPPPKTVTSSMPINSPGAFPKVNQEARPIKSVISLQNNSGKPKSTKAGKTI